MTTKLKEVTHSQGFPGGSHSKESPCNVGRSPEEGMVTHSGILAYACICVCEYMLRVFLEDLFKE